MSCTVLFCVNTQGLINYALFLESPSQSTPTNEEGIMSQITNNKGSSKKILAALRAEVAARDAAQETEMATIMAGKPNRPHKGEPELNWLIPKTRSGKKSAPSEADLDKTGRKKPGKPKL